MFLYDKVFALGVYPTNSLKAKPLQEALAIMSRDDPSLLVGPDPENTDEILMQVLPMFHMFFILLINFILFCVLSN